MTIGEKVLEFRKRHLLTQQKTADLLGVSLGAVHRIEAGTNKAYAITEAKWERMLAEAEKKLNGGE